MDKEFMQKIEKSGGIEEKIPSSVSQPEHSSSRLLLVPLPCSQGASNLGYQSTDVLLVYQLKQNVHID